MKLVIGNKCYSSWSLRPWLLMRAKGIAFEEVLLPFGPTMDDPTWKAKILAYNPAGKVPVLVDDAITVWDSLAIAEYLAERFPEAGIWPADRAARAHARCISAEMHSGFGSLRSACPMNLGKRYAGRDRGSKVTADVARITAIWGEARERFGDTVSRTLGHGSPQPTLAGPFLYGDFCAADAMFAPVVTRLDTYGIQVDAGTRAYMDAVLNHPAYEKWLQDALEEPWIVDTDECDEPPVVILRKIRA
jgi:glutathione S-transferase